MSEQFPGPLPEEPKEEKTESGLIIKRDPDWHKKESAPEAPESEDQEPKEEAEKPKITHEDLTLRISELSRIETRTDFSATLIRQVEEVKKLNSGETKLTVSQIDVLISSFESYETRITAIHGSWEKTDDTEGELDQKLSGDIARDIDTIYGNENFLSKHGIMDKRHVDVLDNINSYVKEESFKPTPQEHQTNVEYIRGKRDLLASAIENIDVTPRYRTDQLDYMTDEGQLKDMLEVYDRLLENLEKYSQTLEENSSEGGEFNLFEYKISIIRAIIAELNVWKMEIIQDGVEPEPIPEPTPEPKPGPVNPTPVPKPSPESKSQERILIADVSEILKAMAWRIAENRLNEIVNANSEPQDGTPGFRGFLSRVGAVLRRPFTGEGRRATLAKLGEQGYLVKFYNEAIDALENDQDLRKDIEARLWGESEIVDRGGAGKVETYEILDAVVTQMEKDLLEREERGENLEAAGQHFTELFQRHMMGEFADRSEFEAAATELIRSLIDEGVISPEQFTNEEGRADEAVGLMFATNLWEIAERNKQKVIEKYEATGEWQKLSDEQKKLFMEQVASVGKLDVQLALKFTDLNEDRALRPDRCGGYLGFLDRLSNFSRSHPIAGAVMNPAVLGYMGSAMTGRGIRALVGAGAIAGGVATGGTLFVPLVAGAIAGGTIAAIKRSRNLKYDRGMEQRREALGQEGAGRRAAEVREFGFSGVARSAEELTTRIEAGDATSAREALALIQAERRLRAEGRPADLIYGTSEETERTGSSLVSRTKLLEAMKNFEENYGSVDGEDVTGMMESLVDFVDSQDDRFESDRRRKTAGSFAFGAVVGAVSGIVAQEIADHTSEIIHGEANNRITMIEYLAGQRPRTAQAEMYMMPDGTQVRPGEVVKEIIEMPDSHQKVEVAATLVGQGENARWEVVAENLPKGYSLNPSTGEITHSVAGISGEVRGSDWAGIRDGIAERFGFEKIRASWTGFAHNGTPPEGSSWAPGSEMHSNGTELQFDIIRNEDGSGYLSVERMIGHTAFGGGRRTIITPEKVDALIAVISPRDRQLQHDGIAIDFGRNGRSNLLPTELMDQITISRGGRAEPGPGMMFTINEILGQSGGKTRLYEIAADFNTGNSTIDIPGYNEGAIFNPALEYIPPVEATDVASPNAIPWDPRRPLGDVIPKSEEESLKAGPEKPKERSAEAQEKVAVEQFKVGERVTLTKEKIAKLESAGILGIMPSLEGVVESKDEETLKIDFGGRIIELQKNEVEEIKESTAEEKAERAEATESEKKNSEKIAEKNAESKEKGGFELDALSKMTEEQRNALNSALERIIEGDMSHAEKLKSFSDFVDNNFSSEIAEKLKHVETSNGLVSVWRLSDRNFIAYLGAITRRIEGGRSRG